MGSWPEDIQEYKRQLGKGTIQRAYRGLMEYMMGLRTFLGNKYPDFTVSGSIYYGYMDMTYFSFFPKSFKAHNLKIAVVFIHEAFRFEVWLAGSNKQIQTKYWGMIKESGWKKYLLVPTTQGVDAIIEHVLVEDPDFSDPDALTGQIERRTLAFIRDVEDWLGRVQLG